MKSLIVAALILAPALAFGAVQKLKAQGGKVEALAVGSPSFLKIRSQGDPPQGEVEIQDGKVSGAFEFELKTLDSGVSLRTDHMLNKYLQVKEHPKAKLEIQNVALDKDFSIGKSELRGATFNGQLSLHGVTKPVSGVVSVSEEKEVEAGFKIRLSEYQIDVPKYLGITVADEVEVTVKIDELKE